MSRFRMSFGLALAALCVPAVLAPVVARAQAKQPVVVVSLAGVEENLADVTYITRVAGVPDIGKTAVLFGGAFTQGIDKKRPIAIIVTPVDGDFQAVACVPVADMEKVLTTLKNQGQESSDAGDGILEFGEGNFFLKSVGGWAYVARELGQLKTLPAGDPAALVGDLAKTYNVAARVHMRNVPAEHKKWAIEQMQSGFDSATSKTGGTEEERQAQEKLARGGLQSVIDLIEQTDTITFGVSIDPAAKKTFIDVAITAQEGSKLAGDLAAQAAAKSNFTGFIQPESAAMLHFAAKLAPSDIVQIQSGIKTLSAKALEEINRSPKLDAAQKATAKEVVATFFEVISKSADAGMVDGGAVVKVDDTVSFVSGGFVADGPALEGAFRKLVEVGKSDPDFPSVKLNVGEHAGVKLHRLTAKMPRDGKPFFGDLLEITLGVGPKSVYVAGGTQGEALLKQVIDTSVSGSKEELKPMQLSLSVGSILKAVNLKQRDPLLTDMVDALAKTVGNDKVKISSKLIPRGSMSRFEVDEGVLQLVGIGIKRGGIGLPGADQ